MAKFMCFLMIFPILLCSMQANMVDLFSEDYMIEIYKDGQLVGIDKEQFDKFEEIFTNEEDIQDFMKNPIYRAKGCNKCGFTGYKGRLGVYEIMTINKEIKKLIAKGAHDLEIEEAAVKHGMRTLHNSCIKHILKGETTISEFIRVLGIASE